MYFLLLFLHQFSLANVKHLGNVNEFREERDQEIIRSYRRILAELPPRREIKFKEVVHALASYPSSRFWVSPERAAIVIASMLRGKPLPSNTNLLRRAMYTEILLRVQKILIKHPSMPVYEATRRVVYQPAPSFYMTQRGLNNIIWTHRKKRH